MLLPILTTHDNLMLLRNTATNEMRVIKMANTNKLISEIWDTYAMVYEMGDAALDAVQNCKAYSKWLDEQMSDEYLANASEFTLEMIRSELALVVNSLELDYNPNYVHI
jgi:hypothetical protein